MGEVSESCSFAGADLSFFKLQSGGYGKLIVARGKRFTRRRRLLLPGFLNLRRACPKCDGWLFERLNGWLAYWQLAAGGWQPRRACLPPQTTTQCLRLRIKERLDESPVTWRYRRHFLQLWAFFLNQLIRSNSYRIRRDLFSDLCCPPLQRLP